MYGNGLSAVAVSALPGESEINMTNELMQEFPRAKYPFLRFQLVRLEKRFSPPGKSGRAQTPVEVVRLLGFVQTRIEAERMAGRAGV